MSSGHPKVIARWMKCAFVIGFFCLVSSALAQVNCDKEPAGALQRAIDAARPGDTITVTGTCEENLNFSESRNRITIEGGGKAVIRALNPDDYSISVRGRGIVIRGFTITGGLDGVRVQQGGHAKIDGNMIERNVQFGIIVTEQSSGIIINNTIQYNPRIGLVVNAGSFAHIGIDTIVFGEPVIGPNIVRYNGNGANAQGGIFIERTASARIATNDVSFNYGFGLSLTALAQADISYNTIDGNTGDGIAIGRGSGANLGQLAGDGVLQLPNSTTINNGGFGVRCVKGGYVDGRLGTLTGQLGVQFDDLGCVNTLIAPE